MTDMPAACERDADPAPGPAEPALSIQVVRGLVHLLSLEGIARDDLLGDANIAALEAREGRVPRSWVERICERAMAVTGDPALGLHWTERMSHHTFAPVSLVTSHASSLREAFEHVTRFATLFSDEPFLSLSEGRDRVTVRVLGLAGRSPASARFSAEMVVGGLRRMIRSMWEGAELSRVFFDFPAPDYRDEYARVFGRMPQFQQPFSGFELELAFFDAPSPHVDADLRTSMIDLAEKRMGEVGPAPSYTRRVRGVLVERAPTRVKMSAVARALGMSVRSLRRRLRDEGKSYTEVESDALASVAARLLQHDQHSIKEVAHRMGFSDAATFHRAFKRWTGSTPSSFQEAPRGR